MDRKCEQVIEIFDDISTNQSKIMNNIKSFKPFLLKNTQIFQKDDIFTILQKNDKNIDISCIDNDSNHFNGNPLYREKVKIKLNAFMECLYHHMIGKSHWLDDTGLYLYLSQISLSELISLSSSGDDDDDGGGGGGNGLKSSLENIMNSRNRLLELFQLEIYDTNLWININQASTNFHYDTNHNFLYVLQGSKTIYLSSPSNLAHMNFASVYSTSANHSSYFPNHYHHHHSKRATTTTITTASTENAMRESTDQSIDKASCLICSIEPGDMIFIPEGWIHGIESVSCTMAINIWFRSPLHSLLHSKELNHVLPYILRQSCYSLLENNSAGKNNNNQQNEMTMTCDEFETECLSYHKLYMKSNDLVTEFHHSSSSSAAAALKVNQQPRKRRRKENKEEEEANINNNNMISSISNRILLEKRIFLSQTIENMYEYWPKFANKHSNLWIDLLLSLSNETVYELIRRWDILEQNISQSSKLDSFFHDIFIPCGDRAVEIRQRFIIAKDNYSKSIAQEIVNDLLGIG